MKNEITLSEKKALYERIGNNGFKAYDWWPNMDDLEYVKKHPDDYIEFLIWVLQTACEPETEKQKESKKMIERILRRNLKVVPDEGRKNED